MRDEVIDLNGANIYEMKNLYFFLISKNEPLFSKALLENLKFCTYRYKDSRRCWLTTAAKPTISINGFIAKYSGVNLSSIYE